MGVTVEQKVAAAILEKSVGSIEIDGDVYEVAPPSIATLVLVSELVSKFPVVENVPRDKAVYSVLHNAKYFKPLGEVAAVLIIGAKGLMGGGSRWWERLLGVFGYKGCAARAAARKEALALAILENVRPTVLFDLVVRRLEDMEVGSFFAITTSLSEANMLKPTRVGEVVT